MKKTINIILILNLFNFTLTSCQNNMEQKNTHGVHRYDAQDGRTTIYENYDVTKKQYENSVYCHLKFVMSKEEFKERFEK